MFAKPSAAPQAGQRRPIFFGWYIVAASVATNFYLSISFFQGFQVFFLPIVNEFGWSRTLTSGAFALRQLETGVLAPVVGFMVDRFGPRKVILIGVVFAGAGMVLLSFVNSIETFYLSFILCSFGASGASHGIAWPAALVNWFRRRRGLALGIAVLGPVVGGPFIILVQLLQEALGWRQAILLLGIGAWVTCIPLALLARHRPEPYGYLPDGDPPQEGAGSAAAIEQRRKDGATLPGLTTREALRTRAFWMLVAVFGIQGLGVSGVMIHQIPLLQSVGLSAREASLAVGLVFFLSGIGRMASGALLDVLDRRVVLGGAMLAQALSFVLLAGLTEFWQVAPFALVFGCAFGSTIPARPIILGALFGQRAFGALQGLTQGAAVATSMVGPLVMGASFDLTDSYSPAVWGFAALTLASAPLAFWVQRPVWREEVRTPAAAT